MQQTNRPQLPLHEAGGKATSLQRLEALGYSVPPFAILKAGFFEKLKEGNDILTEEQIVAALKDKAIFGEWQDLFGEDPLAVRSSAVGEDGEKHSFAGQYRTELNVSPEHLHGAIARVWLSGYTAGVQAYKTAGGMGEADYRMAVIVQNMVPADCAGVGFGVHPLTGATDIMVINAVRGLGESLVSGDANADEWEVRAGSIICTRKNGGMPVLTDIQVLQIAEILRRLAADFKAPQDIEFAFEGGKLWLLQSRPVTAVTSGNGESETVWDNSNIVESYPGLTQPLTFSFIEKMYAAVYRQFSLVTGVRKAVVEQHHEVFSNMLGLLNGRVYYNLNSWYAALALLPGYSVNARFMEGMMGVKETPVTVIKPRRTRVSAYLDVVRAVFVIIGNLRRSRSSKQDFETAFKSVYNRFAHKDFSRQPLRQTWQDYTEFETLMLREWKAPLVNDFFAMIYFGVLKKLTAKHLPEHPNLHNELIGASGDIITTQPVKLLPRIAAMINNETDLRALATEGSSQSLWNAIQSGSYPGIKEAIDDYIETWGERTIAELKLETITYVQVPLRLIAILQSYVRAGIKEQVTQSDNNRLSAEHKIKAVLRSRPLQARIFSHVLRQARYFVSNRENLRYYRTRGFGMVRCMMLGIGQKLHEQGMLAEGRDVFFLKLEEVESLCSAPAPLHETVAERKKAYEAYAGMPLSQRIITKGPIPQYILSIGEESATQSTGNIMQGTPCSAGIVRARIRRVADASTLSSLEGCIMATYATDPGYVVLFPTAAGILTERGSLLSHAAIVSREMGIPCIVGLEGLMGRLKDGDEVVMDGKTGTVQILSGHE